MIPRGIEWTAKAVTRRDARRKLNAEDGMR